jgi:hypothetical protein
LQPKNDACYKGSFFEGDSYIVLRTKMRGNAFERDIFFWLGGVSPTLVTHHSSHLACKRVC